MGSQNLMMILAVGHARLGQTDALMHMDMIAATSCSTSLDQSHLHAGPFPLKSWNGPEMKLSLESYRLEIN